MTKRGTTDFVSLVLQYLQVQGDSMAISPEFCDTQEYTNSYKHFVTNTTTNYPRGVK